MENELNKTVFEFNDPIEFMAAALNSKQIRNSKFSIRAWAKQLGHKNPSLLAQTLKGERSISLKLAEVIANNLKLNAKEKRFFELLTLYKRAKKESEKELYLDLLNELRPENRITNLNLDYFRFIADWYHLAILEMAAQKSFSADPEMIAKKLKGKISSLIAKNAVDRLLRLELLVRDESGKVRRSKESLVVNYNIPSDAIRKHHKQMINLALESIEEQEIHEREISGTTLTIDSNDLPKIKKLMAKFHEEMRSFAKDSDGDRTYQFNVQFFKLSE